MLVQLLLPEVHRPCQLGKKSGANTELLSKMKLSADVFHQQVHCSQIL